MNLNRNQNNEILFGDKSANELIKEYGSPLYVYNEETLRERCQQMKKLCSLPNFKIYYSAKANTNISLLNIIREEGLCVDAMTPGEIYLEKLAGFSPDEILFISNNVSRQQFQEVIDQGIRVSLDSIAQLELYGSMNPGSEVYIRINPGQGKGAGHHEKVITAGKVKFGIDLPLLDEAFKTAKKYGVRITGITQHIGSLFLNFEDFHESVVDLLELVKKYPEINYVDFGGGFGIPYDREKEGHFPCEEYAPILTETLEKWMAENKRKPVFGIEPGRFLVAEAGVCLTQVHAVKNNAGIKFAGTDLGFNLLIRPEFYEAYHEIQHASKTAEAGTEVVDVVGNICESGDTIGKQRELPVINEEDVLVVRDTGAYGYSMASNYNGMCRPAELLVQKDGSIRVIRKREDYMDLAKGQM